jgi:hypothetical protein
MEMVDEHILGGALIQRFRLLIYWRLILRSLLVKSAVRAVDGYGR